jgi:hypothetical protein
MAIRNVPIRSKMFDELGNLTRTWIDFFRNTGVADVPTPSAPSPPVAADWTVSVLSYGNDPVTGKNVATLQVVITPNPADVVFFSVFSYPGVTPPADPASYVDVADQVKAASGATTLLWIVDRPLVSNQTYQIVVTASNDLVQGFPSTVPISAPKTVVVTVPAFAAQVTGFSVTTIIDTTYQTGRLIYALTPPVDPEYFSANIYRILCDAAFTPLGGEVYHLVANTTSGYTQTNLEAWPLTTVSYWKFKAQSISRAVDSSGVNLENTTSPPTSNLTVPAASVAPGIPTQPASGDFSVSVDSYGYDSTAQTGVAILKALITINPTDVTYFSVWMFKGGSPPTDPQQWLSFGNFPKATSGNTSCYIGPVNRESASVTYQVAVTASGGATVAPTLASPVHSVVVTSPSQATQVSGQSVVLHTSPSEAGPGTTGGPPSGQLEFLFTPPAGDLNWFNVNIYRIFTDAAGTPLGGEIYHLVSAPNVSTRQPDWWALGSESYSVYKFQSVSRQIDATTGKNLENTTSAPVFGPLHVPATTGAYTVTTTTGGFIIKSGATTYAEFYVNSGTFGVLAVYAYSPTRFVIVRADTPSVAVSNAGVATTLGAGTLDCDGLATIDYLSVGPTAATANTILAQGTSSQDCISSSYTGANSSASAVRGQCSGGAGTGVVGQTNDGTSYGVEAANTGSGGIGLYVASGFVKFTGLQSRNYANNAAAVAAGLTAGQLYSVTGSDPRQTAVVF